MELKKLHLGTMSYAVDSMDEVAHQLATALGVPTPAGQEFFAVLRAVS
jgi:phospholipid-translocating ATPase